MVAEFDPCLSGLLMLGRTGVALLKPLDRWFDVALANRFALASRYRLDHRRCHSELVMFAYRLDVQLPIVGPSNLRHLQAPGLLDRETTTNHLARLDNLQLLLLPDLIQQSCKVLLQ